MHRIFDVYSFLSGTLIFFVHLSISRRPSQATHGAPAPRNSHPHTSDETNEFLVVHNGIITNYAVLREMLMRHGFAFVSETDTEARRPAARASRSARPRLRGAPQGALPLFCAAALQWHRAGQANQACGPGGCRRGRA